MLKIITYPNKLLRKKSTPIEDREILSAEFKKLINEMIDVMFKFDGVGLAAPQIGKNKRLVVINIDGQGKAFINPKIISKGITKSILEEGCLSVPGIFGLVRRPKRVKIKYKDINNNQLKERCDEYLSRVIQHEIDHLEGILFVDKMIK